MKHRQPERSLPTSGERVGIAAGARRRRTHLSRWQSGQSGGDVKLEGEFGEVGGRHEEPSGDRLATGWCAYMKTHTCELNPCRPDARNGVERMMTRRHLLEYYLGLDYPYTVVPDDGSFLVSVPDLPNCVTQVDDAGEIAAMAEKIRTLWIKTEYERDADIPEPWPAGRPVDIAHTNEA